MTSSSHLKMVVSLEIREHAAKLYTEAWSFNDKLRLAEDSGANDETIEQIDSDCANAWAAYYDVCDHELFELLTEASGTVLRCAETQIPLCDLDEVIETETGQLMRVKQAA